MKGTVLYKAHDVRFEELERLAIMKPTDAILRLSATCVCGQGLSGRTGDCRLSKRPMPFGHEYCGIVEEVGREVRSIKPGQFVVGSFFASDNTCPICRAGYQSSCVQREGVGGAQAQYLRVPLEDGATDIVSERGDEGVSRIKEMTEGLGTDSVLECVGTQEAMIQAIRSARLTGG